MKCLVTRKEANKNIGYWSHRKFSRENCKRFA